MDNNMRSTVAVAGVYEWLWNESYTRIEKISTISPVRPRLSISKYRIQTASNLGGLVGNWFREINSTNISTVTRKPKSEKERFWE